ncbi:hypothetical protein NDU88_006307 [Pleurodeles waltl]|uniref:Uncharacterized protein n=1 Tax=Pleurodeles waltl TaxID=8319 RepID=A0AAV7QKZ4_PLEWA|nr:hypothetical protein NDU88_006307 [Pleurodeles waltl]
MTLRDLWHQLDFPAQGVYWFQGVVQLAPRRHEKRHNLQLILRGTALLSDAAPQGPTTSARPFRFKVWCC